MDQGRHLLLYDGVCGLCTRLVDFVIQQDHQSAFSFAAIQSDVGSQIMTSHGGDPEDLTTLAVVLNYQSDPIYSERGDAAVALLQALGGIWKIGVLSKVLPSKARDWLYSQVAVRRYRVFGELDACRVPTLEASFRFIDAKSE
jgi:predicted DCC family thiol-disulfide oxidoreductase YuxK